MQRWRPDTCGCVFDEQVHGDGSKTCAKVVVVCPDHEGLDGQELYEVVYAAEDSENKRKNTLLSALLESNDGQRSASAIQESDVAFQWEGRGKDRVLVPSVRGARIPVAQRKALTSRLGNAARKVKL